MKKVYIYNQGCPNRGLDANRIKNYFLLNGYSITEKPVVADIIILMTCAYVKRKEDEAIKLIRFYQRHRKKIIVAGCLSGINRKRLKKVFNGPTIMPKNMNKIDELFSNNTIKFSEIRDVNYCNSFVYYPEMQPFYIRISEGCLGKCSYCGIKNAIGKLKSKPLDECLREFKEGLERNYYNFTIISEDAGAYGLDIGLTFPKLLRELVNIDGDFLLTIYPINPKWLIFYLEDLIPIFRKGKIKYLLISIQSGSKRILKLMNRFSNIKRIYFSIKKIKRIFPYMLLGAHILVGFPSETEEDFQDTLRLVKELGFNFITTFCYSERPSTESVNIFPKISRGKIVSRLKKAESFLVKNKIYFKIHSGT